MHLLKTRKARKSRRVAAIAASPRMMLGLAGGIALVAFALRDVHLRIELRRQERADRSRG